jgi:predicted trehalose synthase
MARRRSDLPDTARQLVEKVLSARESLASLLHELLPDTLDAVKIRHHGDFHLGQMLIVKDDVFIIDFEGEPRRSIEDRRRKAPAARGVAGLIRSIDYSATGALERALKSAPMTRKIAPRSKAGAFLQWPHFSRATAAPSPTSAFGRSHRGLPTVFSISFCWRRRSTRSNTSWRIAPIGCECHWPARGASCRDRRWQPHDLADP